MTAAQPLQHPQRPTCDARPDAVNTSRQVYIHNNHQSPSLPQAAASCTASLPLPASRVGPRRLFHLLYPSILASGLSDTSRALDSSVLGTRWLKIGRRQRIALPRMCKREVAAKCVGLSFGCAQEIDLFLESSAIATYCMASVEARRGRPDVMYWTERMAGHDAKEGKMRMLSASSVEI